MSSSLEAMRWMSLRSIGVMKVLWRVSMQVCVTSSAWCSSCLMCRAISSMFALSCESLASSAPASTLSAAWRSKKSKKLVCRGRSRDSMVVPPGRVLVRDWNGDVVGAEPGQATLPDTAGSTMAECAVAGSLYTGCQNDDNARNPPLMQPFALELLPGHGQGEREIMRHHCDGFIVATAVIVLALVAGGC